MGTRVANCPSPTHKIGKGGIGRERKEKGNEKKRRREGKMEERERRKREKKREENRKWEREMGKSTVLIEM